MPKQENANTYNNFTKNLFNLTSLTLKNQGVQLLLQNLG